MATNARFDGLGRTRSLPVASGVKSGDPVVVGGLVGVALTDRQGDADTSETGNVAGSATVALSGAFDVTVTGAAAGAGAAVYITSGGALNMTSSGNTLFGYTIPGATDGSKGASAGVITVEIAQA